MNKADVDARIRKTIRASARNLRALSGRIHGNPELGLKEIRACAWQVALLRKWGLKVQTPFAGLSTAYRAVVGRGKPVFCLMAEYDALPDIGHACGHNLICTAALGAARALAGVMKEERLAGTLVVMGTPAEESVGGKIMMMRNGALDGVDAALMAHPSFRTIPDTGSTAVARAELIFTGKSAHAAASPEKGKNALDAVLLLFHGVNAWRQQLPETSRVHGIVQEGGVAPNIIPDRATCIFYIRSPKDSVLKEMTRQFLNIAKGAALMTGTKLEVSPWGIPYAARWPNRAMNGAYVEAARAARLEVAAPDQTGRGSSDFGNVSQAVPGAHVYFGIATRVMALHSVEFEKASASSYGFSQTLKAAEALAVVGHRYFADAAFRQTVRQDFLEDRKRAGQGSRRGRDAGRE
jgi:amidohydrolase